ncbi:TPA: hypothetical protein P0E26_005032 [Vibrio harveyi]|nr:hypothetical protein [Vibrio harveyi]
MSEYEALSIVIACIAALVSLLAIRSNRELQRRSNELQLAQSKLAEKQLEILERDDANSQCARVKIELRKSGSGYKFHLTNTSEQPAKNVSFRLHLQDGTYSPLIESELEEKLPIPVLEPGNSITFIAALSSDTAFAYNVELSWTNPDNKEEHIDTYVAV